MIHVRPNNAEGREVLEYAESRIRRFQAILSGLGLSERDSDVIRGRINELQMLIQSVHNAGESYAD